MTAKHVMKGVPKLRAHQFARGSLVLLAVLAAAASADFSVSSVMVFKNGYGFVEETGDVSLTDGWFDVPEVPQASFGLLWLGAAKEGLDVDRALTEVTDESVSADADTLDELLVANEGATVTVTVSKSGGEDSYTGKLARPVFSQRAQQPYGGYPAPTSSFAVPAPSVAPPFGPYSIEYVVLELDGSQIDASTILIPRSRVEDIAFESPPTRARSETHQVAKMRARVVRDGKPADGDTPVTLTYMRKGISWLPSYGVMLGPEGRARMRLDATLINDVADLEAFVVGVPNFILQDMLSPSSVRLTWEGLSSYFSQGGPPGGGGYSQLMVSQMANVAGPRMGEGGMMPGMGGPMTGPTGSPIEGFDTGSGAQEDLFVYSVKDVTLPRGGRGLFRVWDQDATYEDVYLLTLEDDFASAQQNVSERISDPDLARALERPRVWHAVRLTNTSDGPWTTGAAAIASAEGARASLPIGQSLMTFTPPGQNVDLKLTVAPDVTAQRNEVEVKRELNALSTWNRNWNRVTLNGQIELSNSRSEPARVIVRRRLVGAFTEASEGGAQRVVATSAYSVNPLSEAEWDVSVPADGKTTVHFEYQVYVAY